MVRQEKIYYSDLFNRLSMWQRILRLSDWNIDIKLARLPEFVTENSDGENAYSYLRKESLIRVLHPEDYALQGNLFPQNMDETIVHELLHLHFAPFFDHSTGSAENQAQEQVLCILARIIVDMYAEVEEMFSEWGTDKHETIS